MKVIVLTGGGTSGHVTPNIALIPKLKAKGYEIHYIGSKNGIEKQLAEKQGLPYHGISAGKFRRYADVKNITDLFRIAGGFFQSLSILKKVKPDIVFSKGGFVSCPVVWASWVLRIPAVIHESDITPGLTNKLTMPFARKVCYTFPESKKYFPDEKACHTGLPVREEMNTGSRLNGLKLCGFTGGKPVLVVIGGSQGSEFINTVVRDALEELLKTFQICHICGKGNMNREYDGLSGYKQFEYIDKELPDIFACADLFISRAGATVLHEILTVKKPALLIPLSKSASRGDQILNAQSFCSQGFSDMLMEENVTKETLVSKVRELYVSRNNYIKSMKKSFSGNAVENVISIIDEIAGERDNSK
ncbi:MAG: undecaprenyldiphospho-muramoylpentapeptide beta-N-acetylglucosaminyltransferase [Clostridiaceae bacterium]|nr:undecaprenyldiphospho-muramoylpentapeptide beta-N-acetylglucosaminyltransferase [Clostridiaceae bacterium]